MSQQAGRIQVNTSDNVQVAKVHITILALQQGDAAQVNHAWWEFETATEGNIIVEAFDLAGNRTKYEA